MSFTILDILSDIKLTKEQLTERVFQQLAKENTAILSTSPSFTLDVSLADFKAIAPTNYSPKMIELKSNIIQAMQSEFFKQQWQAYCLKNGWPKVTTLRELAVFNTKDLVTANKSEYTTKDEINEDLQAKISSFTNDVANNNERLKEPNLPSLISNGLKKASLIRVSKFATLDKILIVGKVGNLTISDIEGLDEKLKQLFRLA